MDLLVDSARVPGVPLPPVAESASDQLLAILMQFFDLPFRAAIVIDLLLIYREPATIKIFPAKRTVCDAFIIRMIQ